MKKKALVLLSDNSIQLATSGVHSC